MSLERTRRRPPHEDFGATAYFVSTRKAGDARVFVGVVAQAAVDRLKSERERYGFLLLSYCFMPDHAHIVVVPADQYSIVQTMRVIKGSIARRVNELRGSSGPVWQEGFFDKVAFSREQLNAYIEYTEQNPVKGRLAVDAADYAYSSADGSCQTDYEEFMGLGERSV